MSLLLLTAATMILWSGCYKTPAKYQYGPDRIPEKPVSLADQPAPVPVRTDSDAISTGGQPGRRHAVATSAYFLGDVDSAIQEAANAGKRQRIFVLITDGKCPACLEWEEMLTAPEVLKQKQRGWIYVKADVTWQKQVLKDYKLTLEDLPVGIVVSDVGNENYRFLDPPSSPAVMAQWLIDRR